MATKAWRTAEEHQVGDLMVQVWRWLIEEDPTRRPLESVTIRSLRRKDGVPDAVVVSELDIPRLAQLVAGLAEERQEDARRDALPRRPSWGGE